MQLVENFPLAKYTTFYIGGPGRYLVFASSNKEIIEAVEFAETQQLPHLILGGGSNMLINDKGFNGVVIKLENIGIDVVSESASDIELRVASGEIWDDVVRLAVEEEWWGIENLSHIPGQTGAVAVQNVGAYGQEASEVITKVAVFDKKDKQIKELSNTDLLFTYRHSIFNTTAKDRYVILETYFKLKKNGQPTLTYGDLIKRFAPETKNPSISEIRSAIIEIRDKKFPFPNSPEKGNSGSFFRGPLLSEIDFEKLIIDLKENFGEVASQKLESMRTNLKVAQGYKTPTAFLLDLCELKDLISGGAGINPTQPAVIVNFTGHATSQDVLDLYKKVYEVILTQTGISLEIEPELVGFTTEELAYYRVNPKEF